MAEIKKKSDISEEKPKPCCVCLETRKARDDCMVSKEGDPLIICQELIEAHRQYVLIWIG
ncbi:hypothetical protein PNEG_00123 [Pneumocystis murina B123]|uniref:Cytochrome c oxidase copper chaperone n=1 Tax=Pneumocystis murina (strain B123) TaxID=1069680 RepID=M7NWM3_PNEMU|nr:hypothetical protein PNEG_00123 [Pneumocystis murina B123]EMR11687.1 hypothetical protein PNEG_00123 [Pneumocystis murina B123]